MRRPNTNIGVCDSDVEVFRPERFLDIPPAHHRYAMLRFGIGPRKLNMQEHGGRSAQDDNHCVPGAMFTHSIPRC